MTTLSRTFGIAARNFTAYPEMPDILALVEYGVKMEQLGFDSLWVWDHVLLGVEPNFPIIEALTLLTAIAARTKKIQLGTGVLVLPLRNPVLLAKQLSSMDLLSEGRLIMGSAYRSSSAERSWMRTSRSLRGSGPSPWSRASTLITRFRLV
jgi:alkanesulfonate monooxygenase SsuD/methylene tetrahydromethanopterin reductase-like flavin-dependent oxidoreductase (luciferase family)